MLEPGRLLIGTIPLGLGDGMAQFLVLAEQLPQLGQPLTLPGPAALQGLQGLLGEPAPLLQGHPFRLGRSLRRQQGKLHPAQIGFGLLHGPGLGGGLHTQLGRRLIHQIDGGIGQAAVAEVAVRQPGSRHQGAIGDGHAVVDLVALLEAAQDLQAGVAVGLADLHLLEAALKGRILLDRAAVVLGGGGADAAQIAPGQHGLEQAGRIGTGALAPHHRVQFIDEQHHATAAIPGRRLPIPHLGQHLPQALLELPPKLGAGDQGPQVEGHEPQAPQGIRHIAGHDSLGEGFHHSGLAHAGFTHQHGIVLAAARQHLDQAADLGVASDHRIEFAGAGGGGEVAAVAIEGGEGGLSIERLQAEAVVGGRRLKSALGRTAAFGPAHTACGSAAGGRVGRRGSHGGRDWWRDG